MQSSFDPSAIEQRLYAKWEASPHFAPTGNGEGYCILIPPPNVTGTLHMGHALNQTLMDTLIRYQRMKGRRTLWQMGTDHAGIATQMLVERQLAAEDVSRHDIGREAFIERVWEWRAESGGTIAQQIRRMGSSLDWSRDRFTMDDAYATAVLTVFERLFDEGLIYRGKRLVNWDPKLGTAISDLEVENTEEQGHLWHFHYPLMGGLTTREGDGYLTVATTRPETMLGDTAVAVHPDDERYQHLIGGTVLLPLADREIPIIADSYVDREFGTGCVKITPAHDFNDNEVGARHDLPLINIFTSDACINEHAPDYEGLTREQARKAVVRDLDAAGLLGEIKEHKLMVPRGDRSGAIIEPLLTDQWFVKIKPLAEPAIAAVENGDISFVPKNYENVYFSWMRDIQDWTISRQQWWGHQIPAYYDDDGNIYVAASEAAAREKYGLDAALRLTQERDVLETWFSSALWPFATLGWPEETTELEEFLPTDTLITGHDIIFFWVARMIMMTLHFTGKIPFRTVYIHGLVRDADGNKMSKSKGNGLDPLDFIDGVSLDELVAKRTENLMQPQLADRIEKATRKEFPDGIPAYGTDAVRFTFCALATTGRDVRFDLNRVEGNRNFCNKLWNATRFVLTNTEDVDLSATARLSPIDQWIISKLNRLLVDVERALATYRFDIFANAIYEFAWHEYCDWYLELAKPRLWDKTLSAEEKLGTQRTLLEVLEALMRITHPVMPFITETIWQEVAPRLGRSSDTIMVLPYPTAGEYPIVEDAETQVDWLKGVITGVRNIRGEANIKPSQAIDVLLQDGDDTDRQFAEQTEGMFKRLANVAELSWLDAAAEPPPNALALVGNLKVMVPLAGLIDIEAERARLGKEIDKLDADLKRVTGKLSNQGFVAKAPAAVVEKERQKASDYEERLAALNEQMSSLSQLNQTSQ